jgi:hypothetical protein
MASKSGTNGKRAAKSGGKNKAKDTAAVAAAVADAEAIDGAARVADGMDAVAAAADAAAAGRDAVTQGASDLTRGTDELLVADRVGALADVVAVAGITDVEEGAELIATSEDIAVLGAVVRAISQDDLDRGMQVARISGEMSAVAIVVSRIGMPVLAAFLEDRAEELLDVSVDAIVRAGGTRAVSRALADAGERVEILGENEEAEGLARLVVADDLIQGSDELAEAGAADSFLGYQEMEVGEEVRQDAVDDGAAGLAEAGQGMEELGSAGALADVADQLEQ